MEIMDYVVEKALILIPVLMILGKMIKQMEIVPNKFIPAILLAIGLGLSLFLLGLNVDAVVQGVLITGAAVFGHQALKQIKKTKDATEK
ncbi:phage holin family protein [Alkalibacillus almallahensis]|uniref:phage holin family protein n=1 Tax=Alkalibacillus almallahensis TaxID=1379154 RepID=UPI001ABA8F18|nr:phage holin family protein [Alkalibacillus almallahensis]NIK10935.1 polyferredoxin [Alkalibacillus almallahensis]